MGGILKRIVALLFLCVLAVAARADWYTGVVTITNVPSNNHILVVNAGTNTWKTTVATASVETAIDTNSISASATNLFRHYANFPVSATVYAIQSASNAVTFTALQGSTLTITTTGGWATVSITTNAQTTAYTVRVPLAAEPSATHRTNVANYLIQGLNSFATGSGANVISNRILEASATISAALTGVTDTATIDLTKTGNNVSAALSNSLVTAGQYGSASTHAQFHVDAFGRLTNAASLAVGIDPTNITTGVVLTNATDSADIDFTVASRQVTGVLSNTTATAGNFGSAILVPTNVVDAKGRLTGTGSIAMWATNVVNSAGIMLSVTANQISGSISNTGVSAASYGSAGNIVTGTWNAAGQATALGTVAVVASATNAVTTYNTTNAAAGVGHISGVNIYVGTNTVGLGGSGDCVKIMETNFAATVASLSVSLVGQNYRSLRVDFTGRGTTAATSANLLLQFNGDGGANYDYELMYANASTATGSESFGQTSIYSGNMSADSAPAGVSASCSITIPHFTNTVWNKESRTIGNLKFGTSSGNIYSLAYAGYWRSSAAVTNLTFTPSAGSFQTNTMFTIWGYK